MPGDERTITLTDEQITRFLGDGGTGVLSLANDDTPYSIPISYGYDPTNTRFYFRLGIGDQSEKQQYLTPNAPAQFVVYEGAGSTWTSVVATGTLSEINPDTIDRRLADILRRSDPPLYELWTTELDDVEFHVYELNATTLTGRKTP